MVQIIKFAHLAGCVALTQQRKVLPLYALAVIDDHDLFKPPLGYACKNGFATCIKGVVQEFPHYRGWSFNNLTGSNSLGYQRVE